MSEYIEEAIAQAEKMLCPKGLSHTGENNRSEHGHTECWVIGELLNEIDRLREQVAEYQNLYLLRSRLGDAIGGAW